MVPFFHLLPHVSPVSVKENSDKKCYFFPSQTLTSYRTDTKGRNHLLYFLNAHIHSLKLGTHFND